MKIKLLHDYNGLKAGQFMDPPKSIADMLIARGRAVLAPEEVEGKQIPGPPENKALRVKENKRR